MPKEYPTISLLSHLGLTSTLFEIKLFIDKYTTFLMLPNIRDNAHAFHNLSAYF